MKPLNNTSLPVYFAYALHSLGLAISWQFVTHFIKWELDVPSEFLLTVALALPALVTMLSVNVWGALSDRINKRRPFMVLGFFSYATTFMLTSFVSSYAQYLIVVSIGAAFSSAALPMGQAYLTDRTSKKGETLGYFLMAQSAGWFFGALFSGLVYTPEMMFTLYRVAALLSGGAAISSIFLVKEQPLERLKDESHTSFSDLLRRRGMIILILAAAVSALGMHSIAGLMAIMITDELGGPFAYVGYANAAATLIAVLITGYVGKIVDKRGPVQVLVVAYFSYILFAAGFAVATSPEIALILWALPIYPLSSTAAFALGARISGERERGRAMSLVNGAQNLGMVVGPLIGGFFAELMNRVQPVSWVNVAFNFLALFLALGLVRRLGWRTERITQTDQHFEITE
ncbi:MAG: MFS transporter [Candidatus Thorarchaeota archaeon]